MVKYQLRIKKSAEKELEVLTLQAIISIRKEILKLIDTPFPTGYKKLKGFKDLYRIRSGVYRIIYTIHKETITIEILKIGHRKDIYY